MPWSFLAQGNDGVGEWSLQVEGAMADLSFTCEVSEGGLLSSAGTPPQTEPL